MNVEKNYRKSGSEPTALELGKACRRFANVLSGNTWHNTWSSSLSLTRSVTESIGEDIMAPLPEDDDETGTEADEQIEAVPVITTTTLRYEAHKIDAVYDDDRPLKINRYQLSASAWQLIES